MPAPDARTLLSWDAGGFGGGGVEGERRGECVVRHRWTIELTTKKYS